jgi:hypothetical protein
MRNGANSLEITPDRDHFVVWDFTDIDFRNLGIDVLDQENSLMKKLNTQIQS